MSSIRPERSKPFSATALAARVRPFFDAAVRERGERYLQQGRITLGREDALGFHARARGSAAQAYVMRIQPDEGDDPLFVDASCTCPHYRRGDFCKHLWGFVRALDVGEGGAAVRGTGELVVRHELDGDGGEYPGLPPLDEPAFPSAPAAPSKSTGRATGSRAWRRLFSGVGPGPREAPGAGELGKAPARREAWFVINPDQSREHGGLVVDFHHRQRKKDGELGAVKREAVSEDSLELYGDPEDRRLLGLLLGNTVPDPGHAAGWVPYQQLSRTSGRRISPAMYDVLLRDLCATHRLVWPEAGIGNTRTYAIVSIDEGAPWRFRVQGTEDLAAGRFELEGELYRDGGDLLRATDTQLVLADGLVIAGNRLSRLETDTHPEMLGAFADSPSFVVPFDDREKFVLAWWSTPARPESVLPPALQMEARTGAPQGAVRIETPVKRRYDANPEARVSVSFDYEGNEVDADTDAAAIIDLEAGSLIERDFEREAELLEQLRGLGVRSNRYYGGPTEYRTTVKRAPVLMRELIAGGWRVESEGAPVRNAGELIASGWLVESEGAPVRNAGELDMRITSGIDWFDLHATLDFDGLSVGLPELLEAAGEGESVVTLGDGSHGLIPADFLEKFGSFGAIGEKAGAVLRFSVQQTLLLDALLVDREAKLSADAPFEQWRERLASFERIEPVSEPASFQGELRPYQREGLAWLRFLDELGVGGCLADDMGLGKTVQVLALLEYWRTREDPPDFARRPSVVVVPRSLVHNWVSEAGRFAPRLRVLDYTGAQRGRLLPRFADADLVVMTYGTLRRDIAKLSEQSFHYALLDEAQAIKNARSQAAKACRLLQAHRRLTITGTPVENHLGELWSLFEFLNPGLLGRASAFEAATRPGAGADPDTARVLATGLRPFILRRTKSQVLDDLPEKTEQTMICELGPKQRKLYDELRDYYRALVDSRVEELGLGRSKIHVLEALLRLRQAACHPGLVTESRKNEPSAKLDSLIESLTEVVAEGHKALVFSQFTSFLALVEAALDRHGIVYEYLDGQTRDRAARVQRFQTDPDCPLFLVSLKAGGQGLNLTAADYVFILDPWWNPAVEAQAVDRAHRIGQTRHVFAYRLVARDTVEEKIVELKARKQELADAVITADESLIRGLTREDLSLLLG